MRILELDYARDRDAIQSATSSRGADEVEIEVWEGTRFIGWLAVPTLRKTVDPFQKIARLITLIAMSGGVAVLGAMVIRWSVGALS